MRFFPKTALRFKRFFNLGLNDPKAWNPSLWQLGGSVSESGEVVTEETAMTYSAFWNAITLIAGPLGSLPLNLMQKVGRNRNVVSNSDLHRVLHTQYNPYMTAMAGRECLALHILTWGNGYAEKVKNGYGEVIELWPIPPNRVTSIDMVDDKLIYTISVPGEGNKYLTRDQILHVPGLGFDGFIGYSVVAMAKKTIGLGMALETFGSKFFSQGINPGAVIRHPNKVKDIKAMREALSIAYAGLGKSHRLMLLEEGMEFDKVGIPPEDSQFIESRQFQITDMARWTNLPVHKLKEMSKSSFNNIYAENASYVIDSLLPWFRRFEQNYDIQLIKKRDQKNGMYFKHNFEGLLRGSPKERAEFYSALIKNGMMTPNEGREKEDMNPSDDPLMDEFWMPTGLIPVSKFDEYLSKNQNGLKTPTDPSATNTLKLIENIARENRMGASC